MQTHPANDDDPLEDELIGLLADYEEQLLAGSADDSAHRGAPQALQPRLERAREMLRLLARAGTPETSAAEAADTPRESVSRRLPDLPRQVGRFEIQHELGHGGCGIVYLAVDPRLRREVALKIPLTGALITKEMRDRFLREAWAAASLDHPNIVPVYEAGHDGLACYIASAYCRGPSLADWLKENTGPVPARLAARLVAEIADGVDHAHGRGVFHRDLKPGNVMLDPADSHGDSVTGPAAGFNFIPRVTDFGLAKLQEDGIEQTRSGVLVGTAGYMAPEQATGKGHVDARADVYALGSILYELLVGRPPFVGETQLDTLEQVKRHEPVPPRRLRPELARDLETICLKCLEKEPIRRYESAQLLRQDLQRFLEGRPIAARPIGRFEHAWRWSLRNRTVSLMAVAVAALLFALLATSVGMSLWLNRERLATLRTMGTMHAVEADALRESGRAGQRFDSLTSVGRALALASQTGLDDEARMRLRNTAIQALALADLEIDTAYPAPHPLDEVAFDSALTAYASPTPDGNLAVHDLADGTRQSLLTSNRNGRLSRVRFSPNGRWLAALQFEDPAFGIHIWSRDGERAPRMTVGSVRDAAFDIRDDGLLAFIGEDGDLVLFELPTASEVRRIAPDGAPRGCRFSPSGNYLAVWEDSMIRRMDVDSGAIVSEYAHPSTVRIQCVAWSPHEDLLASGGSDYGCYVWETSDSTGPRHTLKGHAGWVTQTLFDASGELLFTSGNDGKIRGWNPWDGRLLVVGDGQVRQVSRLADRAAGIVDKSVVCWQLAAGRELRSFHLDHQAEYEVDIADVSPDGTMLATGAIDGLRLWSLPVGKHLANVDIGETWLCVFENDGQGLFTAGAGGLDRWSMHHEPPGGNPTITSLGRVDLGEPSPPDCATISRNGAIAVAVFGDRARVVHLNDAARSGSIVHPGMAYAVISPDSQWIASLGPAEIRIWDAATHEQVGELATGGEPVAMKFDPQLRWLVVATAQQCLFWETGTWNLVGRCDTDRNLGAPRDLAFAADGRMAAIARAGFRIELVDVTRHQVVATLPGRLRDPWVAFCPTSNRLYCGSVGMKVECWDLALIRQGLRQLRLDWD